MARSMTNTSDLPLMSVSALHRHTSSRSGLTETARSALLYQSKCISRDNLTAKLHFEATCTCKTCSLYCQLQPRQKPSTSRALKSFPCADTRDKDYGKNVVSQLEEEHKVGVVAMFGFPHNDHV